MSAAYLQLHKDPDQVPRTLPWTPQDVKHTSRKVITTKTTAHTHKHMIILSLFQKLQEQHDPSSTGLLTQELSRLAIIRTISTIGLVNQGAHLFPNLAMIVLNTGITLKPDRRKTAWYLPHCPARQCKPMFATLTLPPSCLPFNSSIF